MRGDFGESLRYRRDALSLVLERVPATLELAGVALALTFVVAVPLGVLSAVRRDGLFDHLATVVTVLGQAVPGFWLGLMLAWLFGVQLKLLPFSARLDTGARFTPITNFLLGLWIYWKGAWQFW